MFRPRRRALLRLSEPQPREGRITRVEEDSRGQIHAGRFDQSRLNQNRSELCLNDKSRDAVRR
jgi:hypothetical protein